MEFNLAEAIPDPVLSNIAIQSSTGGPFIADDLCPVRTVGGDLYRITKWGRENITPDVSVKRAFGNAANKTSMSIAYQAGGMTYDRSLAMPLADEVVGNNPNPQAVENNRVNIIMNRLRLDIELDLKKLVLAIPNTTTIATQWSGVNPTIEKDIDTAKELFVLQFGIEANSLLIPVPVRRIVKRDPAIRQLRKDTDSSLLVDGDLPPQVFGLNTITPRGIMKKSPAAAAIQRVWDMKNVTLMYIDPNSPDEDTNTWGIQARSPIGAGLTIAAYRWRDPNPTARTTWVAAAIKQNEDIVNSALALTILNVIA